MKKYLLFCLLGMSLAGFGQHNINTFFVFETDASLPPIVRASSFVNWATLVSFEVMKASLFYPDVKVLLDTLHFSEDSSGWSGFKKAIAEDSKAKQQVRSYLQNHGMTLNQKLTEAINTSCLAVVIKKSPDPLSFSVSIFKKSSNAYELTRFSFSPTSAIKHERGMLVDENGRKLVEDLRQSFYAQSFMLKKAQGLNLEMKIDNQKFEIVVAH